MRSRQVAATGAALGAGLIVASWIIGGTPTAIGCALGIGAGLFGIATLYYSVWLLRGAVHARPLGIALIVLGFLAKFPVIVVLGYLAKRQGWAALGWFVGGLVWVYSAVVWRAYRSGFYSQLDP